MSSAEREPDTSDELEIDRLRCPRCRTYTLRRKMHAKIEIDVCETCRGIWLDRGELDAVLNLALVAAGYQKDLADDDDASLVPAFPRRKR